MSEHVRPGTQTGVEADDYFVNKCIAVLFSVAVGIIIRSGLVRQAVRWRLELGERGLLLTGLSIHAHALKRKLCPIRTDDGRYSLER